MILADLRRIFGGFMRHTYGSRTIRAGGLLTHQLGLSPLRSYVYHSLQRLIGVGRDSVPCASLQGYGWIGVGEWQFDGFVRALGLRLRPVCLGVSAVSAYAEAEAVPVRNPCS